MDISKLRSDRVHDQKVDSKVAENKGAASSSKTSAIQAGDIDQSTATEKLPSQNIENVKWSAESELIADGIHHAKQSSDTRSEKVAALKAAIRNGTYKVDPRQVADKMIQSSLEDDLLTRKA